MIKKLLPGTLLLGTLLLAPIVVNCQTESSISLTAIETQDEIVEVSLTSNTDFIVGGNRYILHIGGSHFKYSKHPKTNLKTITFLIPKADFAVLQDGQPMVIAYGLYPGNIQQDGEVSQQNGFEGPHWSVGKLNKSLLKK